jgi:hypothetical protein
MQPPLEQRAVKTVRRDSTSAETVDNGPREADVSCNFLLHLLAVSVLNAFCYLAKEAAGVASVFALSTRGFGVLVRMVVEQWSAARDVVELIDMTALVVVVCAGAAALWPAA